MERQETANAKSKMFTSYKQVLTCLIRNSNVVIIRNFFRSFLCANCWTRNKKCTVCQTGDTVGYCAVVAVILLIICVLIVVAYDIFKPPAVENVFDPNAKYD